MTFVSILLKQRDRRQEEHVVVKLALLDRFNLGREVPLLEVLLSLLVLLLLAVAKLVRPVLASLLCVGVVNEHKGVVFRRMCRRVSLRDLFEVR